MKTKNLASALNTVLTMISIHSALNILTPSQPWQSFISDNYDYLALGSCRLKFVHRSIRNERGSGDLQLVTTAVCKANARLPRSQTFWQVGPSACNLYLGKTNSNTSPLPSN
jgi:hypothetical protein